MTAHQRRRYGTLAATKINGYAASTLRLLMPNRRAASSCTLTKHQITNVPIAMSRKKLIKYMAHSSDLRSPAPCVEGRKKEKKKKKTGLKQRRQFSM